MISHWEFSSSWAPQGKKWFIITCFLGASVITDCYDTVVVHDSVGKTELTKALTQFLFQNEKSMTRIDM